jgi:hypothetical protein
MTSLLYSTAFVRCNKCTFACIAAVLHAAGYAEAASDEADAVIRCLLRCLLGWFCHDRGSGMTDVTALLASD